jgi:hypothetical protein
MKTWTDDQLIEAVKSNNLYVDVARQLGLTNLGSNLLTMKKHIKRLGLDVNHFLTRKEIAKKAKTFISILTNEEIFTVNNVDRRHVKNRIIKENLLPYECSICKLTDWTGQKLSLHLDHINGVNNDNNLDNLRFLCPNCHSLTPTYCAKNVKNNPETTTKNKCPDCGIIIGHLSKRCMPCSKKAQEKIIWPDLDSLYKMVQQSNYTQIGKQLGVSGNAVKNRLHQNGYLPKFKNTTILS